MKRFNVAPEEERELTFKEKVDSIPNEVLILKSYKAISDLCDDTQNFTMSVPPRSDDTDILLTELVKRYEKLVKRQSNILKTINEADDLLALVEDTAKGEEGDNITTA